MDVICEPKKDVIFWRKDKEVEWHVAGLTEMIEEYDCEPFTELRYGFPVTKEGTNETRYHVFFCDNCHQPVLTIDANHNYKFCPLCGYAVKSFIGF